MLSTVAISLSALSIQAAIVLGIAMFVLLIVSWRRPIRPTTGQRSRRYRNQGPIRVARLAPPQYKRPNPVRRLVAVILSGAMGVLIGALMAVVVAYSIGFVVIRLTSMLR